MEAALDSNPTNYEIKSELSNCCFGIGVVYLAKYVPSQQFVALKKFQMDKAKEESNLIRVSVFHFGIFFLLSFLFFFLSSSFFLTFPLNIPLSANQYFMGKMEQMIYANWFNLINHFQFDAIIEFYFRFCFFIRRRF